MLQMQPVFCENEALRSNGLKIVTKQFGTIAIEEDKVITMMTDLPGFPGMKRFIILEHEKTRPFYWFQCIDNPDLALTIINPYLFKPDYSVAFEPILKDMKWESDGRDNLKIYVVVNASTAFVEKITANLIAPILINTSRYEAIQLVIYDSPYSHKHPIFENSQKRMDMK